jgi:peptidoglycan hydrolase CwlO-like protein
MNADTLVIIFYGIAVAVIIWISVMMEIKKLEKKLHNIEEYLDQLYDRADIIGKEIGKMWIDITKINKKIEKTMKNKGENQ